MTKRTLPAPTHVAEALAHARQRLEELRHKPWSAGLSILHPDAGELFARQVIKVRAMSGAMGMKLVIDLARAGWDEAHAALSELVVELKHHRLALPPALHQYATDALFRHPHRSRGRRKSKNVLQDVMFASLMDELVQKFGLHPTRRADALRDSAGDVLVIAVKEASTWLKRSFNYKAAERLWVQWGAWVRQPWVHGTYFFRDIPDFFRTTCAQKSER